MKSIHLGVLFMLLASCNSKTSPQENVTENKPEIAVDSVKKAPALPPIVEAINASPNNTEAPNHKAINPNQVPGANVALNFMDNYVNFCNERKSDPIEWVDISQYVTKSFKAEHKSLLEEAWKDDPEIGLGFDPIFDAQDYPEKGFTLLKFDQEGYMTLQGKNWPEFTVVVKVKQEGNNWLVNGTGVLNIPKGKRATR